MSCLRITSCNPQNTRSMSQLPAAPGLRPRRLHAAAAPVLRHTSVAQAQGRLCGTLNAAASPRPARRAAAGPPRARRGAGAGAGRARGGDAGRAGAAEHAGGPGHAAHQHPDRPAPARGAQGDAAHAAGAPLALATLRVSPPPDLRPPEARKATLLMLRARAPPRHPRARSRAARARRSRCPANGAGGAGRRLAQRAAARLRRSCNVSITICRRRSSKQRGPGGLSCRVH
jgi:hypothetical protein